jgi:MgsA AAA+ ATPase C terminal
VSRPLPRTRRGYDAYECVSALQKSIRRSQVRETVYWGFELWKSGYDNWAWARVAEILSEDIGHADRYLPATIKALAETSKHKKKAKKGGGLEFVHALVLMATAKKSRLSDWLVMEVDSDLAERLEIPPEALDRHTRRGRAAGRDWEHFIAEGAKLIDPDQAAMELGHADMEDMLDAIDSESESHFKRRIDNDPTLPQNPWGQRRNVAAPPSIGQLRIEPEGDR